MQLPTEMYLRCPNCLPAADPLAAQVVIQIPTASPAVAPLPMTPCATHADLLTLMELALAEQSPEERAHNIALQRTSICPECLGSRKDDGRDFCCFACHRAAMRKLNALSS